MPGAGALFFAIIGHEKKTNTERRLMETSTDKRLELHDVRKRAAAAALAVRWGCNKRAPSKTVRVDATAADLLARVPERDRRAVASEGVRAAASAYLAGNSDD